MISNAQCQIQASQRGLCEGGMKGNFTVICGTVRSCIYRMLLKPTTGTRDSWDPDSKRVHFYLPVCRLLIMYGVV